MTATIENAEAVMTERKHLTGANVMNLDELNAELAAAQAQYKEFEALVHKTLDEIGINDFGNELCRIKPRLQALKDRHVWMQADNERLTQRVAKLEGILEGQLTTPPPEPSNA